MITQLPPQNTLSIPYPTTVRVALAREPQEFATEARELLAVKLYELGRLSSSLAAQLAGVSREEFMFVLSRYGVSPFHVSEEELEQDVINALTVSRHRGQ